MFSSLACERSGTSTAESQTGSPRFSFGGAPCETLQRPARGFNVAMEVIEPISIMIEVLITDKCIANNEADLDCNPVESSWTE